MLYFTDTCFKTVFQYWSQTNDHCFQSAHKAQACAEPNSCYPTTDPHRTATSENSRGAIFQPIQYLPLNNKKKMKQLEDGIRSTAMRTIQVNIFEFLFSVYRKIWGSTLGILSSSIIKQTNKITFFFSTCLLQSFNWPNRWSLTGTKRIKRHLKQYSRVPNPLNITRNNHFTHESVEKMLIFPFPPISPAHRFNKLLAVQSSQDQKGMD